MIGLGLGLPFVRTAAKKPALKPELIVNGDFSAGLTGWTLITPDRWTLTPGVITSAVNNSKQLQQDAAFIEQGKTYVVTYTAAGATVNAIRVFIVTPGDVPQTSYNNNNGVVQTTFTATASGRFSLYCYAAGVRLSNISVREV